MYIYLIYIYLLKSYIYIYIYIYMLWGHILPYPKDGLVQRKHISSLGEDNFSFLTRHLIDRLLAENG